MKATTIISEFSHTNIIREPTRNDAILDKIVPNLDNVIVISVNKDIRDYNTSLIDIKIRVITKLPNTEGNSKLINQ